MLVTGILFVVMYVCLFLFTEKRHYVAVIGAVVFIITGQIGLWEGIISIDYNVLLMIAGSMGLVYFFIQSKMPILIADLVLSRIKSARAALVAIALLTGIISAFVDNVATVLMMVPIAFSMAERLKVSPISLVIAVSVSSNLQGAATLVGDTTSILLGSAANLTFFDFFFYHEKLSIFFVVEMGAIISGVVLWYLFREYKQDIEMDEMVVVEDYVPSIALGVMLLGLIIASFIPNTPNLTNGTICIVLYLMLAVYESWKMKSNQLLQSLKSIDYQTLMVLSGVFIAIAAVESNGLLEAIASVFASFGEGNPFLLFSLIVWGSVVISAFVDNIPYVAAMLPVVSSLAIQLQMDPTLLYFGLLSGSTLGGNLTPIGASANITAIGLLRKKGYTVNNVDFFKIGIPFTVSAVTSAYVLLWILWGK